MVSELEGAGFKDCLIQVKGDVTNPDTSEELVQKAVSSFGKLDIFVSNAGICQFADFLRYAFGSKRSDGIPGPTSSQHTTVSRRSSSTAQYQSISRVPFTRHKQLPDRW